MHAVGIPHQDIGNLPIATPRRKVQLPIGPQLGVEGLISTPPSMLALSSAGLVQLIGASVSWWCV